MNYMLATLSRTNIKFIITIFEHDWIKIDFVNILRLYFYTVKLESYVVRSCSFSMSSFGISLSSENGRVSFSCEDLLSSERDRSPFVAKSPKTHIIRHAPNTIRLSCDIQSTCRHNNAAHVMMFIGTLNQFITFARYDSGITWDFVKDIAVIILFILVIVQSILFWCKVIKLKNIFYLENTSQWLLLAL